jgi:hypothetical protein
VPALVRVLPSGGVAVERRFAGAYGSRVSPGSLVSSMAVLFEVRSASRLIRCCSPVWLLAWLLLTDPRPGWLLSPPLLSTATRIASGPVERLVQLNGPARG